MSLLANSNAIESGGYNIDRSLRFRSSASAYLSRTPSSNGNRRTWTVSFWIKRGRLATGTEQVIFGSNNGSTYTELNYLASSDVLRLNLAAGGSPYYFDTSAVFRDPSAWYHIVVAVNTTNATSTDRMKLYVNGVQQSGSNNAPSLNYDTDWNVAQNAFIGARTSGSWFGDFYLADFYNIDGQALTPSSFGQTDAVTGVWTPKKYTGTYGTNGFYLPFSDNASATTLAYDKSGNGNNWTPNNISTTAGATYDSMTDVPTLTSATAANCCVLNPLDNYSAYISLQSGNLTCNQTGNDSMVRATFGVSSGKWYWEATLGNTKANVGIATQSANLANYLGSDAYGWGYYSAGQKVNSGSTPSYGSSFTTNDVIGVAFDADAGTLEFYKNGVSQGTAFTGLTSGPYFPAQGTSASLQYFNFGQRPFSYTPPTGFKALNTFNLPDPVIKKPNQYMDATTYTGTGSAQSITNGGFQPDFVWVKNRSVASSHRLVDATRGASAVLFSNATDAESTDSAGLTSFNSNGFSVGTSSGFNNSPNAYVGWQWKKGATPGFDIVTYTGNLTARTISHSLGVAPAMMIVKSRSDVYNWIVYHSTQGAGKYLKLNGTDAVISDTAMWNNTSPTSSVFSVATNGNTNANTNNFVAYLFAEIAGFSKFGSYTGNGSANGPFVYCGFRPKYVMVKRVDVSADWFVRDSIRSPYNVIDDTLYPNLSNAEETYSELSIDFTSNGFKIRNGWSPLNASGGTFIYAAFASNPFKFSNAA